MHDQMETFDFDEPVDRSGTDAIKWGAPDREVLPMWVADMDFTTAPVVIEALHSRVEHGIFGYTRTPGRFYDAIAHWWDSRHGLAVEPGWILPATGVIPAVAAAIRALTREGDKIVIQPPVYNHFFDTIAHCGRRVATNDLQYSDGRYWIDFADLEAKLADPATTLLLLCNPHNPVGRVWTREELLRVGELCAANGVAVVSDEIHADLIYTGYRHIPFHAVASYVGAQAVTTSSPSKTFNLAGMQVAYLFSEHAGIRAKIAEVQARQEATLLSPFAIEAAVAAYCHGADWLEELRRYLAGNVAYITDFCANHLPEVAFLPPEATYLAWLDCRAVMSSAAAAADRLLREQRLWVSAGTLYGSAGEGFLRLNFGCPRAMLSDGLMRLKDGLNKGQA